MHILIADAFDAKLPERLGPFGTISSDMGTLGEAHVLLVRSKTKVDSDLVAKAPNLKLVIRGGVGMDNVDKKLCAEKGIKAVNTPRASSVAVAEMAMAFMVAIPARLIEAHVSMKEGKFLKSELKRTELFKKTLGLIGLGIVAVAGASVPTMRGSRSGVLPWLKMITADAPAACALSAFTEKLQSPRCTRAMLPAGKPAKSDAWQPLVFARGIARLMSTAVTAAVTSP